MRRFLITVILISFSSLSFAMSKLPSSEVSDNLIGTDAPDFTLETTAGVSQSLTQARAGKRAIMIFWASWCPHCHEELEKVRQNLDKFKQQSIQIVLVNAGESKQDAKNFLSRQQISLESFLDEDNTVAGRYSVVGIPAVFFIDEKGVIRTGTFELPTDYENKFDSK